MIKKFGLTGIVVWSSIVICIALFVALGIAGHFLMVNSSGSIFAFLGYSVQTFGVSLAECLEQLALILFVFLVGLACWGMVRRFIVLVKSSKAVWQTSSLSESPLHAVRAAAKKIWHIIAALFPVALLLILVSLIFGEANALDKTRLWDTSIISWEHWLTGHYMFAVFGAVHWSHLIIVVIIGCFVNVALLVVLPTLFVGYATPDILDELITAFSVGTMILVALWLIAPALSPQDRFIDNVYQLPVPAGIASAVAHYHPQQEIQNFLNQIRTEKSGLPDLPTTTIPSAHAFWVGIAGYYFFKSKKWLGWAMSPFLVASALGTVVLAQHYFLDPILSIGVIAIAVFLTDWILVPSQRKV